MNVPAAEARATLPALLDRVADGEEITITRHGRPVAVMVHPDALRVRRAREFMRQAEDIDRLLSDHRSVARQPRSGLSDAEVEARVADLHADRSSR